MDDKRDCLFDLAIAIACGEPLPFDMAVEHESLGESGLIARFWEESDTPEALLYLLCRSKCSDDVWRAAVEAADEAASGATPPTSIGVSVDRAEALEQLGLDCVLGMTQPFYGGTERDIANAIRACVPDDLWSKP